MAKKPKRVPRAPDLRRARFVVEYCKDHNGTQAAIRAGYAPGGAHVAASRLLRNDNIRKEVDAILAKAATENLITIDRTMKEIARIAYGDTRKLYDRKGALLPLHEMDDDAAALVAGVEADEIYGPSGEEGEPRVVIGMTRKVKRWDKGKALDQCMAILGMHKSIDPASAGGLNLSINLSSGKRVR